MMWCIQLFSNVCFYSLVIFLVTGLNSSTDVNVVKTVKILCYLYLQFTIFSASPPSSIWPSKFEFTLLEIWDYYNCINLHPHVFRLSNDSTDSPSTTMKQSDYLTNSHFQTCNLMILQNPQQTSCSHKPRILQIHFHAYALLLSMILQVHFQRCWQFYRLTI